MKRTSLYLGIAAALIGCGGGPGQPHTHGPDPQAYTLYTQHTELFVKFQPLVVGQSVGFAVHLTRLGESFKPVTEGAVTASLVVEGAGIRQTVAGPVSPGLYRLALKPTRAGEGKLIFDVHGDYRDRVVISPVTVYATAEEEARRPRPAQPPNTTVFPKEQAWQVEFASAPVVAQPFHSVIKASGDILSAPGDEVVVTAHAPGAVRYADARLTIGAAVGSGQPLFWLDGHTATDNIESRYREARANHERAKTDLKRAEALVKDRIVSERDYIALKTEYENAETAWRALQKNYSANGQRITAPIAGFIKNLLVAQGQYVTAGTPLAAISQNKKLRLRADVSQRYLKELPFVRSAHFKTVYDGRVYELAALNGRLISYGRAVDAGTPLVPVIFEIDNRGDFVPGALTEVFLHTHIIPRALCVPVTALIEEQGNYYVYVQTGGESFEKRALQLGGRDGQRVQVLAGIAEGERIVTRGAYQIKLASVTSTAPPHGHQH
jgi:RND family efflux transporter MFP subunit